MEELYSKLYQKYNLIKSKKDTGLEEFNRNQEEKFLAYASAADELIEHLRSENDRLAAEADVLRSEVASTRSSRDDQVAVYQKLLMEENQKKTELSQEIERMQSTNREGLCTCRSDKNEKLSTLVSSQVGLDPVNEFAAMKSKHSGMSRANTDIIDTRCGYVELEKHTVRDSADRLSKRSRSSRNFVGSDQTKCFQNPIDLAGCNKNIAGTTICMFEELVECLVGMNVSIIRQADEICYSFSLTWINSFPGDGELLYRVCVSSLGTFERIAPEWMKEVIIFSKKMCPVFFERLSRFIVDRPYQSIGSTQSVLVQKMFS